MEVGSDEAIGRVCEEAHGEEGFRDDSTNSSHPRGQLKEFARQTIAHTARSMKAPVDFYSLSRARHLLHLWPLLTVLSPFLI